MIAMDDIRRFATAFPEGEESLHFRHKQPVFKVKGNAFAGGEGAGRRGPARRPPGRGAPVVVSPCPRRTLPGGRRQQAGREFAAGLALHRERTLSRGGQHQLRVEDLGDRVQPADPGEPRVGQHDRVELTVGRLT